MKRKFILFITFLLFNSLIFAQQISWIKTDFNYSDDNRITGMAKDHYGNIYVTGDFDHDNFGPDIAGIFLKKYNSLGILVWVDTVKANANINSISIDGDFIYISGHYGSIYGNSQITFDSITLQSFGGASFIVKYDLNGNVIWANQILGAGGIIKAMNNSLYFVGEAGDSSPPEYENYFLAHYDNDFALKSVTSDNISMTRLTIDGFDNSIFVAHEYLSYQRVIDKFDALGNKVWSKNTGMFFWNITADNSGNCYLIGQSNSGSALKKINSLGNVEWIIYEDSLSWYNATVVDDTLYICGKRRSFGDPTLRKSSVTLYNAITGQFISSYLFDLFPGATERADFIIKDGDAIYLSGQGGNESGYNFLAKVTLDSLSTSDEFKGKSGYFNIYPNPSGNDFQIYCSSDKKENIRLSIFDSGDKMIFNESFYGNFSKKVDLSKQAKGVYFVVIVSETRRETRKIVLE